MTVIAGANPSVVIAGGGQGPAGPGGLSSCAALYVSANITPTEIAVSEVFYNVDLSSVTLEDDDFVVASSKLTYAGQTPTRYLVKLTLCLSMDTSNVEIRVRIGKNGESLPQTCAHTTLTGTPTSGSKENLGTHTIITLNEGDEITAMVGNWTDTSDITVRNMQLSAIRISST